MKVSFNPMVSSKICWNNKDNTKLNNITPVGMNNCQNNVNFGAHMNLGYFGDTFEAGVIGVFSCAITMAGLIFLGVRMSSSEAEKENNAREYVEQTAPDLFERKCIEAKGTDIDWQSVARELKDSIEVANINTSPKDSLSK